MNKNLLYLCFNILLFIGICGNILIADEIIIDNSEQIKNKYDFILFTFKSDKIGCAILNVECNDKTVLPLSISLGKSNSTIKGMLWFVLLEKNNKPDGPELDFILDEKEDMSLKFTILTGLDNETLSEMKRKIDFRLDELLDEKGVFPPHIKKIIIEQKIARPINNTINEEAAMHVLSTLMLENISFWMDGNTGSRIKMDDKSLSMLKKLSADNSSLSDLCSIFLTIKKIDRKLETHADAIMKKAGEQNRKGQGADIEKIMLELSASLDISSEQKELLALLNKDQDTFLYHVLYPGVYIGNFLECGKWQEAKKLLEEYQNKYHGDKIIVNALNKLIMEFENRGKKPYYLDDKFIAMEFDDIINDQRLNLDEKEKIFEQKIMKLSKEKKLTPELISNILGKTFILAVSNRKRQSPGILYFCQLALLPDENASLDEIMDYEKGLVQFYKNEQVFLAEFQKRYPHCEKFYETNRTVPISISISLVVEVPKMGKLLYDYLKGNQKEKNGLYLKLKEEEGIEHYLEPRSILKILEDRYGKF